MDLAKVKLTKNCDIYFVPIAGAINKNDFHVSFHGEQYGIHFKTNTPKKIKSQPITYAELAIILEEGGKNFLRSIVKLPRGGHCYFFNVFEIKDGYPENMVNVKGNNPIKQFSVSSPTIKNIYTTEMPDSSKIKGDFVELKKKFPNAFITGFVPSTSEHFYFLPLESEGIDSLAGIINDFEEYKQLGGLFFTYTLEEIWESFRLDFPIFYDRLMPIFEEMEKNNIELFDENSLIDLFSLKTLDGYTSLYEEEKS